MKKLRQWIIARRDRRLRKWCVEQAAQIHGMNLNAALEAQDIYAWIMKTK